MVRFRRIVNRDIFPLLEREGLRKPDDGFVSSGVKGEMDAFQRREDAVAGVGPDDVLVRGFGVGPDAVARPAFRAAVPRVVPDGPFPVADRALIREAVGLLRAGDWRASDAWLAAGRGSGRWDAWRDVVLAGYGLSSQPKDVLDGIARRAWALRVSRHAGKARAYAMACAECANHANDPA
ncbi:hypothetical protein JS530_03120 [Bifidobacterium sp. LC6]|uniref:Uncharacterized protein n=1 Tax=Bifidobacterium colobi TaxID=2809026 RepID=A0ABS5UU29_9BIFI|nr:hypothetical protein [Bifidobacterium colobi]MBT1174509.1 hypothetical protein [Bifidobacterium colobi]